MKPQNQHVSTFSSRAASLSVAVVLLRLAVHANEENLEKNGVRALSPEDLRMFFDFFEMVKARLTDFCTAHPEEVDKEIISHLQENELKVRQLFSEATK